MTEKTTRQKLTLRETAAPGIEAVRTQWTAILLIQICALGVVVAYFKIDSVKHFCEKLGEMKARGGYLFSGCLLAFSSGVVPEFFKYITNLDRSLDRKRLNHIFFNFCLFFVLGIVADAFYRLLGIVWGDNNHPLTVIAKVLSDQFGYAPTAGLGIIALGYSFRHHHFNIQKTIHQLGYEWYMHRVATLLLPCWAFWFPMTSLMFSLPGPLQLPFASCAGAASSIILTAVSARKHKNH